MKIDTCNSQLADIDQQNKLEFICAKENISTVDGFMISVWAVVGLGLFCCCLSFISTIVWRVKSTQIDDVNIEIGPRVQDPEFQRRMAEEHKKKMMSLILNRLKKLKYSQSKHKTNQDACSICVEDFMPNTIVRETPCHHLFHEHCVEKWIETKIDDPDCPFCREKLMKDE